MSGDRITRTQTIDGIVTPAFIHNGNHYFIDLEVYADGLVNCWELVDLALFAERLRSGWVTTGVPDGAELHVHGLGSWTVADGTWPIDADAMHARVVELVRTLNPRMENLHDCHGRTEEVIDGVRRSILPLPSEQPVRIVKHARIRGESISVFVRQGDTMFLGDLRAYADGVIEIGRLPRIETLDRAALTEAIEGQRIASSVPVGGRVEIWGLGAFTVAEEQWSTEIADVSRSVPDLIDAANGRPDSVQRCRDAYAAYIAAPTETTRAALRVAYEAVPSHNQMYVGDMDVKDVAVRMAIYGDQEIEGWSHRIVARAMGAPLPTIDVPRPEDE